jgi:hypothetical protein
VTRIPRPDEVSATDKERVQPWLEPYTHHVIQLLVGTKGLDQQEVVRTMLRDWIREHKAELDTMGIQPPKVRDSGIILNHEEAS